MLTDPFFSNHTSSLLSGMQIVPKWSVSTDLWLMKWREEFSLGKKGENGIPQLQMKQACGVSEQVCARGML